jgi:hypothetical protein
MLPKGIDIWDFAATVFLFGFCAVAWSSWFTP